MSAGTIVLPVNIAKDLIEALGCNVKIQFDDVR